LRVFIRIRVTPVYLSGGVQIIGTASYEKRRAEGRVAHSIQGMNLGEIIVWIIVGGFAGTLAGRAVTFKKEGLGRWMNLLVGMAGAVVGGALFRLFRIDLGLGQLKVTFEDLIAAFLGSLLVIFVWRMLAKAGRKGAKKRPSKP
jgi:uncharacterized membrane protein YeaQ/YmgE (transglycosylase-associated protein family)